MTDFLDHLAAADAALAEHLCTAGVLRPGLADAVDPVSVAIERPTSVAAPVAGQMGVVLGRPVAWLPVEQPQADGSVVAVSVRNRDALTAEGRRWEVVAAPTRPGDGRWWRCEVNDLGPV